MTVFYSYAFSNSTALWQSHHFLSEDVPFRKTRKWHILNALLNDSMLSGE